jgi:ACT domain-containing protein
MMMMVSLDGADIDIDGLRTMLNATSEKMHVEINVMAERVFSAMHRI